MLYFPFDLKLHCMTHINFFCKAGVMATKIRENAKIQLNRATWRSWESLGKKIRQRWAQRKELTNMHAHTHTSLVTLLCIPLFWWIKFSSVNKQNNFKVVTLYLLIKIASVIRLRIRLRIRLKADKVLCYAISKILFSHSNWRFLGACSFFPLRYCVLQRKTFCMGSREYVFLDYTVFA